MPPEPPHHNNKFPTTPTAATYARYDEPFQTPKTLHIGPGANLATFDELLVNLTTGSNPPHQTLANPVCYPLTILFHHIHGYRVVEQKQ